MKSSFRLVSTLVVLSLLNASPLRGQNIIKAPRGYAPQIGTLVAMLEDLRARVARSVVHLTPTETDFLLDEKANRIGALILHLAATEKYYQVYTFEDRGFNAAEEEKWETALNLGPAARKQIQGQSIGYYLEIWAEVRAETLALLKTKDDAWLAAKVKVGNMNNHWAWYHVMEHQANHMGQLRLIIKRME